MRKELLTFRDPKSPVSEIFRTLRTNIQFMNTNKKLKTLLVTSTFPEEGKSWVTANLAVTFAQAGKKVVLIDADMRKGRQYTIFGVLPKPGLSNYLSNMDANNNETEISITKCIQETDVDNLHILTAGNVPPNPSELLVSRKMRDLLNQLKDMCDLIIIDGTPCDLVTDAIILSRIVDSTIIVTAQKETKRDNLSRIVKNIQNVGGKIAGVVVNKVDMSTKKYNQAYYYGSISGNSTSKKSTKKQFKNIDDLFAGFQKKEKEMEILDSEEELEENPGISYDSFDYEDHKDVIDYKEKHEEHKDVIDYKEKHEEQKYDEQKKADDYNEIKNEIQNQNKIDEEIYNEQVYKDNIYENNNIIEENNNNIEEPEIKIEEKTTYQVEKPEVYNNEQPEVINTSNNYIQKEYTEIEAKVESEGKISEVKIDQNMDEKTKEILRQVNEYIESEKRRQGEKY